MEKEEKSLIIRQITTYGTIIGALIIVNSIILFLQGINEFTNTNPSFFQNLRILIAGGGIFFSMRHLTDKILERRISFGQYLLFGLGIGLAFGIIDAFYFVIFVKYLDPSTIENMLKITAEQYTQLGFTEDQISVIETTMQQPVALFFSYLFADLLNAFIYAFFFGLFYIILPRPKKEI